MRYQRGDLVKHPNAPEWGVGRVINCDSRGKITIFFTKVEKKELDLSKVSFDLIKMQSDLSSIKEYHKEFLAAKGIPYRGVNHSGKRSYRTTGCYSCKGHLDNKIDIECVACNWIICRCGACGCGYSR